MLRSSSHKGTEKERRAIYWAAWRIMAHHSSKMSQEDKHSVLDVFRSYFRDVAFDPLAVTHVERMTEMMAKPHYI